MGADTHRKLRNSMFSGLFYVLYLHINTPMHYSSMTRAGEFSGTFPLLILIFYCSMMEAARLFIRARTVFSVFSQSKLVWSLECSCLQTAPSLFALFLVRRNFLLQSILRNSASPWRWLGFQILSLWHVMCEIYFKQEILTEWWKDGILESTNEQNIYYEINFKANAGIWG